MQLRPATPEDVDAIVALVASAYRDEASRSGWTTEADLIGGQRTDREEVLSILPHVIVTDDVDACCVVEPRGDHAYFGMFAVRPDRQGNGIGSKLLEAAEEHARDLGMSAMELTVISLREELISYYERRGYRRTGETKRFPYGDDRFGVPRRPDLEFSVLRKPLVAAR